MKGRSEGVSEEVVWRGCCGGLLLRRGVVESCEGML
jgi:hypothetical protein